MTVYEPQNVPEDPNTIKDSDCETVKLVKELLNTYPSIPMHGSLTTGAFVLASFKMAVISSSMRGSPKRERLWCA